MRTVWFWLRVESRSTLRAFVTIAVLTGLAGGVVLASLIGASRTDGAYPAFLRASHASDVEVGIEEVNGDEVPFLDKVEALPEVAEHTRRSYVFLVALKRDGTADFTSKILGQPLVSVDGRLFRTMDREKLIAGRLADPAKPDEVTVGRELVRSYGLRVGETIDVAGFSPTASRQILEGSTDLVRPDGPHLQLHVVGEVVAPGELAAASYDNTPIHLTPAFWRKYHASIGTAQATRVQLRDGADDARFRQEVDRLAGQGRLTVTDQAGLTAKVQRSIHLQATSLRLFALLVGGAGVLIIGQALVRQLVLASDDYVVGRGLGMTRSQLMSLSLTRAAIVGIAGAALAAIVATVLSPFSPIGLARVIDVRSGVHIDILTTTLGAAAIIAVTLTLGAWPAWTTARVHGVEQGARGGDVGRSSIAAALGRSGLSPQVAAGSRLAFEAGAGHSSVPVRSTIVGSALAVGALAMSVCFGASLTHLLDTPRLYGWNWDVGVGNPYAYDIRDQVVPTLLRDRDVLRVASVSTASVTVDGRSLTAVGFEPLRGTIAPPLVSGRTPLAADELTAGPKTLRALHKRVGETVTVAGSGGRRRMHVVGRAVYASVGIADPGGVGEGVGMTLAGLRSVAPDAPQNIFPIDLRPGVNFEGKVAALRKEFAIGQVDAIRPTRPTDIDNYGPVRRVPLLLAAVLGAIALGALGHTLLSSVRRRRRDLAVLKALGFVRRQVRTTIAWQATALIVVALVIGLPLGVALGTWVWRLYAVQQGVVPEPEVPLLALATLAAFMLVMANAIAAVPAVAAARTRPSVVLRAE